MLKVYGKRLHLYLTGLLFLFVFAPSVKASGAGSSEDFAYVGQPSGVFLNTGGGYYYLPDFQPLQALSNIIWGGVSSAVAARILAPPLMKAGQYIPCLWVLYLGKLAWQFRYPLLFWRSYYQLGQQVYSYPSRRTGYVPVYLSSARLDPLVMMHWHYPADSRQPLMLELVLTPKAARQPATEELSAVEGALLSLIKRIHGREGVRLQVYLEPDYLVLTLQVRSGQWFYRRLPRPDSPLLAEALRNWKNSDPDQALMSLLQPSALRYLARSLTCSEHYQEVWQNTVQSVVGHDDQTVFALSGDEGDCDRLHIADHGLRLGGMGGFMYLETSLQCDTVRAPGILDEAELMARAHNRRIPPWLTEVGQRAAENVVSGHTSEFLGQWLNNWLALPEVLARHDPLAVAVQTYGSMSLSLFRPGGHGRPAPREQSICYWMAGSGNYRFPDKGVCKKGS